MAKKTRATGAKTKKWFSGSVDEQAGRYMYNEIDKTYPGGISGFKQDASSGIYKRQKKAKKAMTGADVKARINRAFNNMTTNQVTEVTYNKPKKTLKTPMMGRDIPLPKSK